MNYTFYKCVFVTLLILRQQLNAFTLHSNVYRDKKQQLMNLIINKKIKLFAILPLTHCLILFLV